MENDVRLLQDAEKVSAAGEVNAVRDFRVLYRNAAFSH